MIIIDCEFQNYRKYDIMIEVKKMNETVLCYIENENDEYLMLYRCKKKNDLNEGKWLGIGGHIEPNEEVEDAVIREVYEETGLTLTGINKRGIITFINDDYVEVMHLFTSNSFYGDLCECDEGQLKWVNKSDILDLPLWQGDKEFLMKLINADNYFEMKLYYSKNEFLRSEIDDISKIY